MRLGGQPQPAHADPRAAVVRMHDGAEAGIGSLPQLAGRAALLMPPRAAADCRGVPLATTIRMQREVSCALRRHSGIARLQRRTQHAIGVGKGGSEKDNNNQKNEHTDGACIVMGTMEITGAIPVRMLPCTTRATKQKWRQRRLELLHKEAVRSIRHDGNCSILGYERCLDLHQPAQPRSSSVSLIQLR